jgi:hypothetical protein
VTFADASEANRSAVACALIGVVGTLIVTVGFWSISGPDLRLAQGIGLLINAAGLLVLRWPRFQRSTALSNAVFLLVLVPTVTMVWLLDDTRAAHSARWVPYEPNKLSVLTMAMIAPPGWSIGIIGIVMFVGTALVHHVTLAETLRARMTVGEPVGIMAAQPRPARQARTRALGEGLPRANRPAGHVAARPGQHARADAGADPPCDAHRRSVPARAGGAHGARPAAAAPPERGPAAAPDGRDLGRGAARVRPPLRREAC